HKGNRSGRRAARPPSHRHDRRRRLREAEGGSADGRHAGAPRHLAAPVGRRGAASRSHACRALQIGAHARRTPLRNSPRGDGDRIPDHARRAMTHLPPLILVVDDEGAGRFVKGRTLRRAGFDVRDAATGSEGPRLTLEIRPDVIVLDVNLPDMSGLEVCERLRRADSGPPAVQILQISSTAITTADRVRGLDYGADVYLIEPVDSEILIATVRALLR